MNPEDRQLTEEPRSAPGLSNLHLVFLLALSAVLFNFSFPPYVRSDGFPIWVALVPMVVAARLVDYRRLALAGWLVGWVSAAVSLLWLRHVSLAAVGGLGLYLSFYAAAFLVAWKLVDRGLGLPAALTVPLVWVPLEYLRSFLMTGFAWFYLGHSLYRNLPLIQIADIFGAYGVSALVAGVNGLLADAVWLLLFPPRRGEEPRGAKRRLLVWTLVVAAAVGGSALYGFYRLARTPVVDGPRVALIQGNIPQSLKFTGLSDREMFEAHRQLSLQALPQQPDLIIWPETMLPGIYHRGRFLTLDETVALGDRLKELLRKLDRPLLAGVRSGKGYGERFRQSNSVVLLQPDGTVTAKYDKIHLVPFGEYVPLLRYFGFLKRFVPYQLGLEAGTVSTVFELEWRGRPFRFGVLICYEDTTPHLSRDLVRRGVDWLVNPTNEGWFKDSAELDQHVVASVFRAVETHRPVLRAANTGITSIISPRGREVARMRDPLTGADREVPGLLVYPVPLNPKGGQTLYVRWGDLPVQVLSVGALLLVVFAAERTRRRGKRKRAK